MAAKAENKATPAKKAPAKPKSDAPSKKFLAVEKRILNNFDNMVGALTSVTPEFIKSNVETFERAKPNFTPRGKQHIADIAFTIQENSKDNPKIRLPKEWSKLVDFAD